MKKPEGLLVALAALAFLAAPASAEQTLRVGKAVTNAFTFTPLDVGMTAGIFKAHGLDDRRIQFRRQRQAATGPGLEQHRYRHRLGAGAVVRGEGRAGPGRRRHGGQAGAALSRRQLERAGEDGRRSQRPEVSSSTVGSLTTWLVRELSRQQGWGPDGIKLAFLGEEPTQLAALRTGETQGATVQIAAGYRLEELHEGRILYRFGDIAPHFIIHVIYARKALIASDPDAVRKFLAGLVRDHQIHGNAQGAVGRGRGADHGRIA